MICGRPEYFPNELSATGKCPECFRANMDANNIQISQHRGPYFERWRAAMAASVGAQIPQRGANTFDSRGNTP